MFRRSIVGLLGGMLILPIVVLVLIALARLLGAMGDTAGAVVLDRTGLGLGIVWLLDMISLVLVLALATIWPPGGEP